MPAAARIYPVKPESSRRKGPVRAGISRFFRYRKNYRNQLFVSDSPNADCDCDLDGDADCDSDTDSDKVLPTGQETLIFRKAQYRLVRQKLLSRGFMIRSHHLFSQILKS